MMGPIINSTDGQASSHLDEVVQGVFDFEGPNFGDRTASLDECYSYAIPPGIRHGFRGFPANRILVLFASPIEWRLVITTNNPRGLSRAKSPLVFHHHETV